MANSKENKWTDADHQYLVDNWGRIPIESIAMHLHRSKISVRLRAMRKNLPMGGGKLKKNLLVELLRIRFRHLEDFTPSAAFYEETNISPRRYSDLFHGRKPITSEEYRNVAAYWNITAVEAMDSRQLELFNDDNDERD